MTVEHPRYARAAYGPVELPTEDHELRGLEISVREGGLVCGFVTDGLGVPIEGVRVRFSVHPESVSADNEEVTELLSWAIEVQTNARGEYMSVPLGQGIHTVSLYDVEPFEVDARTVKVVAGETVAGVSFALKGSVEISGRVTDWSGGPVPKTRVHAYGEELLRYGRSTVTDEQGAFALRGLSPASYMLEVGESDTAPDQVSDFFQYRDTCSAPAEGVEIRLRSRPRIAGRVVDKRTQEPVEVFGVACDRTPSSADEHADGRFELSAAWEGRHTLYVLAPDYALATIEGARAIEGGQPDEVVVGLVRGATLRFRVANKETGTPIEGATIVQAPAEWLDAMSSITSREGIELTTGPDGECSTEHFPPGRYRFLAFHSAFAATPASVEVSEHDESRVVEILLGKQVDVHGRVVLKGKGTPVRGAEVALCSGDEDFRDLEGRSAVTDAEGAFTIRGLSPGLHSLIVSHWSLAFLHQNGVEISEDFDQELLIEMSRQGSIVGAVTSRDGKPVPEVLVECRPTGETFPFSGGRVPTDSEGNYQVRDLEPGPYVLGLSLSGRDQKIVVVRGGEETRADLVGAGAALHGVITRGGKPDAGARLQTAAVDAPVLGSAVGRSWSAADESGHYRFEHLEPGLYAVLVNPEGRPCDRVAGRVQVSLEDVELNIELGGDSVGGVLWLQDVCPAADADVWLLAEAAVGGQTTGLVYPPQLSVRRERSDNKGRFLIEGVAAGRYRLVVEKEGYAAHVELIEKKHGQDIAGLTIRLARDTAVTGSIRSEDGRIPTLIGVTVCDDQGRLVSEKVRERVDPEMGRFFVYGLGEGCFSVTVWAPGYAFCERTLTVASGADNGVEFNLAVGSLVGVSVLHSSGSAVASAQVVLDPGRHVSLSVSELSGTSVGIAGEDGRARFEHVADGNYTVRVRCDGYEDAEVPVTIAGADGEVTVTLHEKSGEYRAKREGSQQNLLRSE